MDDISREIPSGPERSPLLRRSKGPDGAIDAALAEESADHELMTPRRRFEVPEPSGEDEPPRREEADPERADDAGSERPAAGAGDEGRAGEHARERPEAAAEGDEEAPPLEDPAEIARVCLAVLLTTREAMPMLRLAQVCNTTQKAVAEGLERLRADLAGAGFPLEVHRAGESVRLLTSPDTYPYLRRLLGQRKADRLSAAALETLAVIAYRQPVMRAEIEAIRGVKVGPMLRTLLEHKLVDVVGRADVPGRPLQYGTTQVFLDRFGLRSLKDLPSLDEFRALG